jgi:hypothetical protein
MSADGRASLLRHLRGLDFTDATLAAVPPPVQAETAAKMLRRLCEPSADGATAQQQSEIEALLASDAASALCAAIVCATDAIDAIDRDESADTAACGMMRWGHLRVNALQVLLQLASSEARCAALLEQTGDAAATTCVTLLASHASRTDLEGTSAAALAPLAPPRAYVHADCTRAEPQRRGRT